MNLNYLKGIWGEWIALCYLRIFCRYKYVARRVDLPSGEIDIIMIKDKKLIAVEVKIRKELDNAILALKSRQISRIINSLEFYRRRRERFSSYGLQIDLVAIGYKRFNLQHIKNITM